MVKIDSVYDLATLLASVGEQKWPEVRSALAAGGKGHDFAPEVDFGNPPEIPEIAHDAFREAVEIVEQNKMFRRVGINLHTNISVALERIRQAERNIQELKDLGDIEFLEGNGDVEQFLKDAARALRAAQEMKHTDETGEMK